MTPVPAEAGKNTRSAAGKKLNGWNYINLS
jgi:hypothetical protein